MKSYENILVELAKEYKTSPDEIEREMKEAIRLSGFDLSPELFISLCATKVKAEIRKKSDKNNSPETH